MNSSFDTLSDAGRLFGVVAGGWEDDASKNQCCSSKTATATTMSNENGRTRHHPQKLIQSSSSSTHAAATGFTNANDTASSVRRGSQFLSESPMMGDISPIKVVYTSSTSFQDGKNEPHNQEMVMESKFYTFDTLKNTSVVPADWMQEAANHNHDGYRGRSNPIYVIKASRKAFHSVKYLLPCLRSNASCPVNVSDYGSIRQYKERKVRLGAKAKC